MSVEGLYPFLDKLKKNHYRESAPCGDRPRKAIYPAAMAPYTLV
ncbi:hypothetical protein [Microcoleus sp. A006_D1]